MTDMDDTTPAELDAVLTAASAAARPLAALRPRERVALLTAVADTLDGAADELVPLAGEESGLLEGRLRGELLRTTVQLRSFAAVLEDGGCLDAVIDRALPKTPLGPRPDLRRMLVPLGPVLVFAASNFPFAFSVAGGDTASALAAGCPVVVKAHPGHPRLSVRTAELIVRALRAGGAPEGSFALVTGLETGRSALLDPRIKAAAFTGSVPAGRALFDLAAARPAPIPFYGELGSLNPAFVTPGAVVARGAEVAEGYVASFTLGTGQFCTKPGLLFLPRGHGLDERLAKAARAVPATRMLHPGVYDGYRKRSAAMSTADGVRTLVEGGTGEDLTAAPTLLVTDVPTLRRHREVLLEEAFGPLSVVVEYADEDELLSMAEEFEGNLTATVHAEPAEADLVRPLLAVLSERAGRLVYNGWPTGVAVTAAMHHGGPYPATTAALHTSVGSSAITRFLRPVAYQDIPQDLLPEALRDDNPLGVPQRIDGD
ncbi:aldehyde dehydrogenase (NADP(+)) [Streptomyces sp. V3I7]|uniref:aldehyde dehydrogenase (NADP(+)) n=1 Tax=Streptomyces sp. V3I7 TaxID=3042278 RepID=UPI00277F54C1|nr:aldehyde dehydrogenase (NADP(+)) [Streptomyces sp. V3I7]MDQ0994188.1 NADP-dependent aldehyde dehydrogenase [Streptomyces sp. V3I7]